MPTIDPSLVLQLLFTLGALGVLGGSAGFTLYLVGRTLPARLRAQMEELQGHVGELTSACAQLRAEWVTTLGELENVADQVTRRRKQLDVAAKRLETAEQAPSVHAASMVPVDPIEAARRALGVGSHFRR